MEIYKDLNTQANKDFENLLNSKLSKIKIEEGKIIDGLVTKITNKFVFLFVEGLKSEPVLDINELKSLNLIDNIKEGSKVAVLLEKIEDKNGDVVVSATKAQKIKILCHQTLDREKILQVLNMSCTKNLDRRRNKVGEIE